MKKWNRRGKETFNSQEAFCMEAIEAAKAQEEPHDGRVFCPGKACGNGITG